MDFDEPEGIDEPTSTNEIKATVDGIAEIKKTKKTTSKSKEPTSDFEKAKKKLFNQETEHNNTKKPYSTIEIPDSGKLGKKLKIKFSKKVPNLQLAFGDNLVWEREDRFNPKAPKEVILKPTIILDYHRQNFNKDEIEIELGEIRQANGKDFQGWLEGDYLCEVRVFGDGADDETSAKKLVKISG